MTRPGSNTDPNPGPPGQPPYEMAGRPEAHPPVAHFADCTQWVVETEDADASLYRTQEQRLFRDFCGKLVYHATGKRPVITVRPKEPIPIPEPWDCVNAWNWGNVWAWIRRKDTPPLRMEVLILDAAGKEHAIGMGSMAYQYWFVMHRKVGDDIPRPARFAGFRFRNGTNTEPRRIYLGPVSFYQERLKPLTFDPWPEKLPFPTRAETILPTNKAAEFENTVLTDGVTTILEYKGADATLTYTLDSSQPFLDGLAVTWQGRKRLLCKGAQITLGNGQVATIRTARSQMDGKVLHLDWLCQAGDVQTTLFAKIHISRKSLILDLAENGSGTIAKIALGRAEGLHEPRTFWVPYLTYGSKNRDPRILLDDGLFVFAQFDWYVSDSSELFGVSGRTGRDWAEFNGGLVYNPKTDGKRNPLRERLFLTASPDVQEVLPTIPNPPSPMREAQADRQWRIRRNSPRPSEIADAKHLRALGLEKVTVRYHEESWRDAGESFTFRTNAAPGRGGDEALKKMVAAVQATGWRVGLYSNYTDFAPVNSYWNEDWVTRTSDGNWLGAWTRCYAPKPMIAVQMQALLAPQIQAKFGENHSYCDVHTCVTPFQRVDYDARVPGAGTFRRTFECFGRLLYNEKFAHKGPVYSEGRNHWWYAGLTDGNYAQMSAPEPPSEPLFVDFDLRKMHPLQMDAGMGSPGMFYRNSKLRNYRQFMATTLAYGHIGFLEAGEADMMRMYYLLQPLQPHYVMKKVESITYDGQPTSQALASGAIDTGRLRVDYEGGTSVWVNGSNEPWIVSVAPEHSRTLPPWGFLGYADGGQVQSMYALLPAIAGERIVSPPVRPADLAHGPDSHYLASAKGFLRTDSLATDGSGVLKREKDGWELIPARESGVFGFDPRLVDCADRPFAVHALAEDGTLGEPVPARWSRGLCYVVRGKDAPFKYRIVPGQGTVPKQAKAEPASLAVLGQSVLVPAANFAKPTGAPWFRWHRSDGVSPKAGDNSWSSRIDISVDGTGYFVSVPADLPPDRLVWLEAWDDDHHYWFDMLTQDALALTASVARRDYQPGEPIEVELKVANRLSQGLSGSLHLAPGTGQMARQDQAVAIPALPPPFPTEWVEPDPNQPPGTVTVKVPWQLPWQTGEANLKASVSVPALKLKTSASLKLKTEVVPRVFQDLLAPDVVWRKGSCSRGEQEREGLDTVYDGSVNVNTASCGKVTRKALFMHPPWGSRQPGYVFAEIPVELPKEPVHLHAFTGLRDGMDSSDGVVFRVLVTPKGKPTQAVFERHHTKLEWQEADVDLSAFAGQDVTLRLVVDCGPADNTTADHSQWGELALVYADSVLRIK
jgi:hypothetical protein